MKIVVCVKHVPDTESRIRVGSDGRSLEESGLKWVVSPFDEFALEEALRIREARGGEVVLASAGREAAKETLRQGLAMGADRAVLVLDSRYDRCDGLARAKALAAVCRTESADLVLMGKLGVGTDDGQTVPMVAERLGLPHVNGATALEIGEGTFTARREIEGAIEVYEGRLPAVVGCDKGLNEPRYASLKGIMAAKKKTIDVRSPQDLGLDPSELDSQSKTRWESMELPPARPAGRILEGDPADTAKELARLLREEAKVL